MNNKEFLSWPVEQAGSSQAQHYCWSQVCSNLALDFHGDPNAAGVTLFADGNHHMALQQALAVFVERNPEVNDVFYITLPPGVLLEIVEKGGLSLGNLSLSVKPDLLLGPQAILQKPELKNLIVASTVFIRNQGSVLLVRKGNPKNINGVTDLMRDDIRLFISSPVNEKVSHNVYRDTLIALAKEQGDDFQAMAQRIDVLNENVIYGEAVHHREAPQSLISNCSDVAVVYYHLALRYIRIFPDEFEILMLTGTIDEPKTSLANPAADIHMARFANENSWGGRLYDFLQSSEVRDIYCLHGLRPT